MTEAQSFVHESLLAGEFGPILDWLEEQGCVHLKVRIADMLERGEVNWLKGEYFSHIDVDSLQKLEKKAAYANRLLRRRF